MVRPFWSTSIRWLCPARRDPPLQERDIMGSDLMKFVPLLEKEMATKEWSNMGCKNSSGTFWNQLFVNKGLESDTNWTSNTFPTAENTQAWSCVNRPRFELVRKHHSHIPAEPSNYGHIWFFVNKSQRFFFNKMLKKIGFITVSGLNLNPNMAIYGHIWPYLVWFFWAFSKMIKTIQRWAILEHHGYLYWETCCFMMLPGTKELKVFWQEWPPVTGDVQCTRPPHI